MRQKEDHSSRKRPGTLQGIVASTLLIVFLSACNFAASLPTTATTQPDTTVWNEIESPLFPANWPPTPGMVWVSYTFAYGSNPATLMDGSYVTSPLSKTEWKEGTSTTTTLSTDMTPASIQGIVPLDNQTRSILENRTKVSDSLLKMTELPDLNTPETEEMLAYYQAWFQYNGAFLDLIREDHVDFIDWVTANR